MSETQGPRARIAVAGAGSIGCFIGGLLAAAGHEVRFLARPRIVSEIRAHGLTLTDFDGLARHVGPDDVVAQADPGVLAGADLVLVTVKSADTAAIASQIAAQARPDAVIISLQNGVRNAETLRAALPAHDVRAGMVPFNVVPLGQGAWHRATSGDVLIGAGPGDVGARLAVPGLALSETARIEAVQWGKLLLNLNNAINALDGGPLLAQFQDRRWRRIMAAQMTEALRVLRAARIRARSTTPVPLWLVPHILRLPTPLFSRLAARMLTIDPTARTSMCDDLDRGRATEVDAFQGEILRLARSHDRAAPVTLRVADLIRQAERQGAGSPGLEPGDIRLL